MKKIVSVFCTLVLMLGLLCSTGMKTEASENPPMVDGSYLTHDNESTGYAVGLTRGANLQTGYSKIVRRGPELIYAGGTTIAQHTVESVQVSVMVERIKDENGEWEYVDEWRKENTNADLVSSNKKMEVEGDWYYRVCCTHSADGEMSTSFTDGIYIEEDTSIIF